MTNNTVTTIAGYWVRPTIHGRVEGCDCVCVGGGDEKERGGNIE